MKYLLLVLLLISSARVASAQTSSASSNSILGDLKTDGQGYEYKVKYDANLIPYVEVSMVNDLSKSPITTLTVTLRLTVKEEIYVDERMVSKTIPPGTKGVFVIKLAAKYMKFYHTPEDLQVDDVVIHHVRFANGAVKNIHTLLTNKTDELN